MVAYLLAVLLTTTPIDPAQLVGSVMSPSPDIAAEIKKVRVARDNAPAAEKPLYDRLIATLTKVQASPGDEAAMIANIASILRDLADLYPRDFQVQLVIVSTFVSMPATADMLGVDPTPYASEGLTRAKKLIATFPSEGRAWEAYASALTDEREIILTLKKCVQVEPTNANCRDRHAQMLAGIAKPQCSTKDVAPTFGAFEARPVVPGVTPSSGATTKWQSAIYALGPRPIFAASDVAVISRNTSEERVLDIVLTEGGAKKLAAESTRLSKDEGRIAIMVGDTPLTVAHIVAPLTNGLIRMTTGTEPAEAMHYKLCKKVQTPKVPADLRLQ